MKKNMQVLLLAAGKSSRFHPFNGETHKSMFYICGKPIIGWTLDGLAEIGISDVVVAVSDKDQKIIDYLSGYDRINVKIAFQKETLGMGNAILSAKNLLKDSFILGFPHFVNKNIFLELLENEPDSSNIKILTDVTKDPWKYGILEFVDGKPKGIVEKPEKGQEPSNIRASGCYVLNNMFLDHLEKTPQSEYQFEEALNTYMKIKDVETVESKTKVNPCKYVWDLVGIKDFILNIIPATISDQAEISPSAVIEGKVIIEPGAKISNFATVQGPAYIGKDALVGAYSILRDGSVLEEGAQIERYLDCARSMVGKGSHIHSGFIGDSILGESCRIGAGFITANKRIDRKQIESSIKDVDTPVGKNNWGVLIGDLVKIGINVSTMPGVVLGKECVIGPGTVIMENVAENSLLYTEYKKIVKKIL